MERSQPRSTAHGGAGDREQASLESRLFVATERWGWEYLDVAPAAFDAGPDPEWFEPPPPDLSELSEQYSDARAQLPKRAAITVGVTIVVLFMSPGLALCALLVGGLWSAVPVLLPTRRMQQVNKEWQKHCAAERAAFETHCHQRAAWIADHQRQDELRLATATRFQPLRLESAASRVDVFGDTSDGWASLLTTAGSSLLQSGNDIVLVDFSGEHVADALNALARARGFGTSHSTLPAESDRFPLLNGLTAHEVAELLAEVARGPWPKGEHPDHRGLHAELIRTVAELLDGPLTFRKLAAGLRVLRRTYHPDHEVLTDAEIGRLTDHVDSAGQTERVQTELHLLTTTLDDLFAGARETEADHVAWPRSSLTVLTTDTDHRRKKTLDRLVFHRILHDLTAGQFGPGTVLIVAGVESLDLESLEAIARQARRSNVRLVLFMEKLRDELTHLLGRSGSATIFMRLGNKDEALEAAKHLGQGHKFVLSQLTSQVGNAFTRGDSDSIGTQDGEAVGKTTTHGTATSTGTSSGTSQQIDDCFGIPMNQGPRTTNSGSNSSVSASSSRAESVTQSRSKTWQRTVSISDTLSQSSSETLVRTYDFHREPTEFQGLAPTAFILVEPAASGRRVVMGDCNPGLSLLDRAALPTGTD